MFLILYKKYNLKSIIISSQYIEHKNAKYYTMSFDGISLYEVFTNSIYFDEQADINIIQKIDLIHKPFRIV